MRWRGCWVGRQLVVSVLVMAQTTSGLAQTVAPVTAPQTTIEAQAPASPIVTLDRERLFQDSAFGKAIQARFKAASNDLVAENRRLEAALEAEERSLTERRKTADPAAFRILSAEFDTRVEELRQAQDAKSRALTRAQEGGQQRFFEASVPVLGQLMVDLSAVAIIDRSAIILSFDQFDITDQAIARLDATLGEGPAPETAPTGP
jgi:Skp family chaperone for outer membrane proteins